MRGAHEISSPRWRNLSHEPGIVIGGPPECYPRTTEEENNSEENFSDFMFALISEARNDGALVERRERYNPAPYKTGGGHGPLCEVVKWSVDNWQTMLALSQIPMWLLPEEGKRLGELVKHGIASIRVRSAWEAALQTFAFSDRATPPNFLRPNIEGLCLIDALANRSDDERDFSTSLSCIDAREGSTGTRPFGPELYTVVVTSNRCVRTYMVNGYGDGICEIRDTNSSTGVSIEVQLSKQEIPIPNNEPADH